MSTAIHILQPVAVGLAGSLFLAALYLGLVSWAESFSHAVQFFWQDRMVTLPLILGFGVQVSLYVILKKRLFVPMSSTRSSGILAGTSGVTSTISMVACCVHHITDVLPILGLTAAATFLAQYRTAFILLGLGMTLLGIAVMLVLIYSQRRNAIQHTQTCSIMESA